MGVAITSNLEIWEKQLTNRIFNKNKGITDQFKSFFKKMLKNLSLNFS